DAATRAQLERGERMTELLKQGQYQPLPVERQVLIIYAGIEGCIDKLPVSAIKQFEKELFAHVDEKHPQIFEELRTKKVMSDDLKKKVDDVLEAFSAAFVPDSK